MKHLYHISLGLVLGAVILASCNGFRKIQKSDDWKVKYEAGLKYFQKRDYYRSSLLFEDISPTVRGLPEGEKTEFYLAYCHYYEKSYLLASNQFKVFYETYGRSSYVEEASFMYAYSLFAASPDSNLDQKTNIEAMEALQVFLNHYPNSEYNEKATNAINICQEKLEKKGFENAYQYFKIRMYKASTVAFDNFILSFPDSKYVEEAFYLKIVAQYKIATKSFSSLQRERYQLVLDYYLEFLDKYPNSAFLKDAEDIYTSSMTNINNLKTTKNNNS